MTRLTQKPTKKKEKEKKNEDYVLETKVITDLHFVYLPPSLVNEEFKVYLNEQLSLVTFLFCPRITGGTRGHPSFVAIHDRVDMGMDMRV